MNVTVNRTMGDRWGAEVSPSGFDLYTQGAETIAPGIIDYALQIKTAGETIFEAVMRARQSAQMTDYQRQLLDLQVQRATQGQPPLDLSAFGIGGGGAAVPQQGLSTNMLLVIAAVVVLVMFSRKG